MKKEDHIREYGKAAYKKMLQQSRARHVRHREEHNAQTKKWRDAHPNKVLVHNQEISRKGGERYEKVLAYQRIGIPGKKARIRRRHRNIYQQFKQIIAPLSQIHHEWIPGTADFRGVALVEKDPHQYGIIDAIKILEGKITLLTEEEVRGYDNGI